MSNSSSSQSNMKRAYSHQQHQQRFSIQQAQLQQVQQNWGSLSNVSTAKSLEFVNPKETQYEDAQNPLLNVSNTVHSLNNYITNATQPENITARKIKKRTTASFGRAPVVWNPSSTQNDAPKPSTSRSNQKFKDNDYSNHYVYSSELPVNYVRNVKSPVEGYPKLQRLFELKEKQVDSHSCAPYGARVPLENMLKTLNQWIVKDKLVFNVIMIGALTENQFIYPFLTQLPLEKLCSKPGFLFIWASAHKINELSKLLNTDTWAKKFRRSEELVFVPINRDSPYYPNKDTVDEETLFEKMQWHCWMCITGTVRRATDGHLIHCNVDTDLKIETEEEANKNLTVPDHIYTVAENFSSATRRLHIIPSRSGINNPVKPRRGWVIMSPDIIVDNFDPVRYKNEISLVGANVPQDQEIESIRPKSPVPRNSNLNSNHNNHNNRNNGARNNTITSY